MRRLALRTRRRDRDLGDRLASIRLRVGSARQKAMEAAEKAMAAAERRRRRRKQRREPREASSSASLEESDTDAPPITGLRKASVIVSGYLGGLNEMGKVIATGRSSWSNGISWKRSFVVVDTPPPSPLDSAAGQLHNEVI